eukprot:469288-Rhodomonas_salina.2
MALLSALYHEEESMLQLPQVELTGPGSQQGDGTTWPGERLRFAGRSPATNFTTVIRSFVRQGRDRLPTWDRALVPGWVPGNLGTRVPGGRNSYPGMPVHTACQ